MLGDLIHEMLIALIRSLITEGVFSGVRELRRKLAETHARRRRQVLQHLIGKRSASQVYRQDTHRKRA